MRRTGNSPRKAQDRPRPKAKQDVHSRRHLPNGLGPAYPEEATIHKGTHVCAPNCCRRSDRIIGRRALKWHDDLQKGQIP